MTRPLTTPGSTHYLDLNDGCGAFPATVAYTSNAYNVWLTKDVTHVALDAEGGIFYLTLDDLAAAITRANAVVSDDDARELARCILSAWNDTEDIPSEAYHKQTGRDLDEDARALAAWAVQR